MAAPLGANCAAGHFGQAAASAALKWPAEHAVQLLAPAVANEPASHATHTADPLVVETRPAGQSAQTGSLPDARTRPAGHGVQSAAPLLAVEPSGQSVHTVAARTLKRLAAHGVHAVLPDAGANVPPRHAAHAAAPSLSWKWPG